MIDNRARAVPCYAPMHTFVEKLKTLSSKYRRLVQPQAFPANFLRHQSAKEYGKTAALYYRGLPNTQASTQP